MPVSWSHDGTQVYQLFDKEHAMPEYITECCAVVLYLLTPEDSRDTVFHEPVSRYLVEIPHWLDVLKSLVCLLLASALAFLLSRLS